MDELSSVFLKNFIMQKNSLTEGSILKSLTILAVPIVLANLFQTAYQLIDTFWVGRLGAEAIAAVSLSFPILFFLISLGMGMAVAGTILVSQYAGKREKNNVDYVAAQTMLMMLFIGIIFTLIGYFICPSIIRLMGVEDSVFAGAVSYLRISFLGLIFLFGFFAFQSLMRGVGDVRTPLYIVIGTVLLNLFLDPLFIFGWGPIPALGVGGAAMATVATQGLSTVIGFSILFSGKYNIHLKKVNLKPNFSLIQKIFRLGVPASMEQSSRALAVIVMSFLVATFGTTIIASYGIGARMLSLVIIPAIGLSMATSALVGQNMGAGKIDRAEKISKTSAWLGFSFLGTVGIFVFIFAEPLCRFFIPNDPEVVEIGAQYVRLMSLSYGFIGVQQALNGAFRGSGNTLVSMILAIVSLWVFRFPIAYILSTHTALSYQGIWWSFSIANVLAAIVTLIWFSRGTWKKKRITEKVKLVKEIVAE
ncbi:MAG: MATE family efflux transporter [Candidatus Nealsonbacteria bacterium]